MNIEEIENKIKELSGELEKIKENEAKKTVTKRWRAEYEEEYYYIASDGNVTFCADFRYSEDDFRYLTGNYFKTNVEAEKAKNKIIIYMQLKDLALKLNNGEKIDWNNKKQRKFSIVYDYDINQFKYLMCDYTKDLGQIYCLNNNFRAKVFEEIGEEIGEENLKLLYGVDENDIK